MESKKRICIACGKGYHYCPNCSKDAKKPIWMFILCSETCHEVYEILNKRGFKEITDEEAKEALLKLNITGMEFEANTQRQINDLLKADSVETVETVEIVEATATTEETINKEKSSNTKKTKSFSKRVKTVN